MPPSENTNELAMNMPNQSLMYSTYTPIFGNLGFNIAPSQTGEVNYGYGTMPYFSLEGLIYMQQVAASTQPQMIMSGQHTGQQNISGQYTVTGAAGNVQVAIGNATTQSGNF
ncbi:MAG: hypothetical protein KGL39_39725 [Patescibacteria group bacterium]|nr:hypothetical protein [Patescibacteria group bacterium]